MFSTYMSAGVGGTGVSAAATAGHSGGVKGRWEPDVLWLVGLTLAEIVAVALLTKHLLGD